MSTEKPWKSRPIAERKRKAVELRKQGIGPVRIARELNLGTAERVEKIVAAELAADMPLDSALRWQDLELARLDDLQARLQIRMGNGDKGVERDLMKVMDYRMRLQASRLRPTGDMRNAVEQTVKLLPLKDTDQATIQAALDCAQLIDIAMALGLPEDHRRAMNALATMRNLLNDLGASPMARGEAIGEGQTVVLADAQEKLFRKLIEAREQAEADAAKAKSAAAEAEPKAPTKKAPAKKPAAKRTPTKRAATKK